MGSVTGTRAREVEPFGEEVAQQVGAVSRSAAQDAVALVAQDDRAVAADHRRQDGLGGWPVDFKVVSPVPESARQLVGDGRPPVGRSVGGDRDALAGGRRVQEGVGIVDRDVLDAGHDFMRAAEAVQDGKDPLPVDRRPRSSNGSQVA